MYTRLHPIVREIQLLKQEFLQELQTIKVNVHQENLKSFSQFSYHEQLNVHCDALA